MVVDFKQGYDFSMVYYGNIDTVSHSYGPDSEELHEEMKKWEIKHHLFFIAIK